MFPIDMEILKYVLYERYIFAIKQRPFRKTDDYISLQETLVHYRRKRSLLKEPIQTAPFTIFDLETTGLFPELGHEIISIGAIRINGTQPLTYQRFHQHIKPIRPVSKRTRDLTGLTKEDLANAPSFPKAFQEFLQFCEGSILVAYPAAFDMHFVEKMLKRWKLPVTTPYTIDAQAIAKQIYPNQRTQLDRMIAELGIQKLGRHHALNDAIMTAELFQVLLNECHQRDIHTTHELMEIAQSIRKS